VLLDEIEKAHPDVFNVLLQVLDDGRLTDNKGRTVDFKNTIIIMTSNIGSSVIMESMEKLTNANREHVLERTKSEVLELLKQTVRPEFLNRIDEVIMFTPLTRADVKSIIQMQLSQIQRKLAESGVRISLSEYAMSWIVEQGYDPAFGARPVKRVLQKELVNELAKQLLAGKINKEKEVIADYFGQGLVFRN
jgi:ATP-dependent Clp protease ATP-binding subunit ClpB